MSKDVETITCQPGFDPRMNRDYSLAGPFKVYVSGHIKVRVGISRRLGFGMFLVAYLVSDCLVNFASICINSRRISLAAVLGRRGKYARQCK
ncbi:MAG TPA: hypothetical protein VGV18_01670 [Verrucomicrobiae bacterium]|nr:hypothetical protein [Verrucomicrobiae bacterium]